MLKQLLFMASVTLALTHGAAAQLYEFDPDDRPSDYQNELGRQSSQIMSEWTANNRELKEIDNAIAREPYEIMGEMLVVVGAGAVVVTTTAIMASGTIPVSAGFATIVAIGDLASDVGVVTEITDIGSDIYRNGPTTKNGMAVAKLVLLDVFMFPVGAVMGVGEFAERVVGERNKRAKDLRERRILLKNKLIVLENRLESINQEWMAAESMRLEVPTRKRLRDRLIESAWTDFFWSWSMNASSATSGGESDSNLEPTPTPTPTNPPLKPLPKPTLPQQGPIPPIRVAPPH